jgi:tetratricopeptide (TPR) repeat protein
MKMLMALLVLAAPLFAGNMATELFDEGNKLYEKAAYDSAIVRYEKILSMGYHDARVYYNLGNAFFRKQQTGQAVLNYEKALLLDPSDKDAAVNLQFAHASTVDKIVPPEQGFFTRAALSVHNALDLPAQTVLVLALLYLLSFLVILYFVLGQAARDILKPAALVVLILLVPLLVSFGIKVSQDGKAQDAVVLVNQLNAVNEPEGTQVLFTVHEGAKFTLHRKLNGWYFASLENGLSGWVPENDLGIVEINE